MFLQVQRNVEEKKEKKTLLSVVSYAPNVVNVTLIILAYLIIKDIIAASILNLNANIAEKNFD